MSRVYFHSPSGTAELLGRERAHGDVLTRDLAIAALGVDHHGFQETIEPALSPHARAQLSIVKPQYWAGSFKAWWCAGSSLNGDAHYVTAGGHRFDPWELTLNTAVAAGSAAVELLARVHATCEIHGYVEGTHRAWLADLIDTGREDNVLRRGMGWEAVVELLRARADEPVVMSSSFAEGFPDRDLAMEHGSWIRPALGDDDADDIDLECWGRLPAADQWERSLTALRRFNETGPVELHPDVWGVRGFGTPAWSVFDLLDALEHPATPTTVLSDSAEVATTT